MSMPARSALVLMAMAMVATDVCPARAQAISVVVPASGAAKDAWQALEDGRVRDAEQAFARALAETPDDTAVLVGSAVVARRLGRSSAAQDMLARALRIDPSLRAASQVLGSLLRESGDYEGALRVFEAALVRAPGDPELLGRADECRQELERLTRWSGDRASRARIFFDGPVDEPTATLAAGIIERAHQRIGALLQAWPPGPVTLVLATGPQLPPPPGEPEWSTSRFDGRIRMQVRVPVKDRVEFERMLTHEYVHAVLRPLAPTGVPAWLHEGMAALLETDGRQRAERDIRPTGQPLRLAQLEESFGTLPASRVTEAYALSALAVQALVDRAGMKGVLALMGDLTAGDSLATAFQARIGLSLQEFERDWNASRAGR